MVSVFWLPLLQGDVNSSTLVIEQEAVVMVTGFQLLRPPGCLARCRELGGPPCQTVCPSPDSQQLKADGIHSSSELVIGINFSCNTPCSTTMRCSKG